MSAKLGSLSALLATAVWSMAALAQPTPQNVSVSASSCNDYLVSWTPDPEGPPLWVFRDGSTNPIASLPSGAASYLDHPSNGISHTYCVAYQSLPYQACASGRFDASAIKVDPGNWLQDTFTSNEVITSSTFSAYDTTSAWIRTGLNLAPLTGDMSRQDLPGDTVVADAPGSGLRMDLVFRILPGVGNYVTIGNRNSALRLVPTSPTRVPVVPSPVSTNFWESYQADNGAFGTGGDGSAGPGHPSGWDPNRWNSARCDTAETNIFPVEGRLANMPALTPGRYMSMYHEADPKFATLGVAKNRCFLVNPAGAISSANITCGTAPYPPAWSANAATGRSPSEGGLAPGVTREFSQIIPDGQLTPGAHVQYFMRLSSESDPLTMIAMNPDTNFVSQQSGCSHDCARWAQFGVLPDRWKDPAFGAGGQGMACVLLLDYDDGSGDECAWVSIADSIGLTVAARHGAHNGWGGSPPDASVDDPSYFVRRHIGQAGSLWDLYSVRGSRDTLTGNAGSLGSRLAPRCVGCPSSGRESRQGPTSVMLRNYRLVVLLSGQRSGQILGPLADRGQNDVSLLQEFAVLPGGSPQPRGMWFLGSGFGESESAAHGSFLQTYLRATLRSDDYTSFSGNGNASVVLTVPTLFYPSKDLGLRSNLDDVFNVEAVAPPGQAYSLYENVGSGGPYVGSVYGPNSGGPRPFITLLDGFDLADLGNVGNTNTTGRQIYAYNVTSGVFGSISCAPVCICGDVPGGPVDEPAFLSLANNPLRGGAATIRLTMARSDRAKVVIFDVGGRLLRTVNDGVLEEGARTVVWDGRDASGTRVAPGIYWVHASTGSGIHAVKTLVLLR